MKEILEYKLFEVAGYSLSVYSLVLIALIYLLTHITVLLFRKFFQKIAARRGMDSGRQASFLLLFNYFAWISAIAGMLAVVGVQLTFLLVSSSALLVGLGLGLKSVFSDVVAGIFLLFEGSVEIGDVIEVDGIVGEVKEINLRTSRFITRDGKTIIIPNHQFIEERVINWSHQTHEARSSVRVGVSYLADVNMVKQVLLEAAMNTAGILTNHPDQLPDVRLTNFGDNAMDFEVLFFTQDPFRTDLVRSNLRFNIWHAFREKGIQIPSPQRDAHNQRNT